MARILLVEDEPNIITTMRMCLETRGHEILLAEDGVSALNTALEEDIDLILLDILLPKMNGFLVLQALREDPRTEGLPVIVVSARVSEEDIKKARDLDIAEYLAKPFQPQELTSTVDRVLEINEKEDVK